MSLRTGQAMDLLLPCALDLAHRATRQNGTQTFGTLHWALSREGNARQNGLGGTSKAIEL